MVSRTSPLKSHKSAHKLTALTSHGATWFINQIRRERAKELLEPGKLNVSEVVGQVGYYSPSYFTRVF